MQLLFDISPFGTLKAVETLSPYKLMFYSSYIIFFLKKNTKTVKAGNTLISTY